MYRLFSALACMIIIVSCSRHIVKHEIESHSLFTSYERYISENDTVNAVNVKDQIITQFPDSRETFLFASSEFYDRLYPVWNNDSLKAVLISGLIEKYPQISWRRTLYLYLAYSLGRINDHQKLDRILDEFKGKFPQDYLSFTTSSRYHYLDLKDTVTALSDAFKGYQLAKMPVRPAHYPEMEWMLEERGALVSAGSYLAEILIDTGKNKEALDVLHEIVRDNKLSVDDEMTLSKIDYLLGRAHLNKKNNEKALEYFSKGLIVGDSRNICHLCDSMYMKIRSINSPEDVLREVRESQNYRGIAFKDVTEKYGLSGVTASRAAWGDYDNDGYQDLLLDGKRLFKNMSGDYFFEITGLAFPEGIKANGAIWGDLNNNGALDFVTKDPEAVWLNDKGVFRKVTGDNSVRDNGVPTEGIGIADLNSDGFLDIYFANYETSAGNYEHDRLFFGIGGGKFRDVSETSGILPADGKPRAGRGVSIGDFNNSGYQDIFVSNYRLTENFLFVNDGKGNFVNAAVEKGVAGNNTDGWWGHTIGSEWGDLDNDGSLDLVSANLAHPRYIDFSDMTMIYKNSGPPDHTFTDIRRQTGIRFEETHSEPSLGDLNNNGILDIYITSVYEGRRSFLYAGGKDGTYEDVTYLSGTRKFNGWGAAFADIDNDGKLDLIVAGGQVKLFKNVTEPAGNWLQVKVTGKNHSDAIGTRLRLYNKNMSLIREIQGGKGTTNQHSLIQHFGLGEEKEGFTLDILFSRGEKRSVEIGEINRIININE